MKKKKVAPKRIKRWYEVSFRLQVEQDDNGDDTPFDAENSIRVDLEELQSRDGSEGVRYLEVVDVGAVGENE